MLKRMRQFYEEWLPFFNDKILQNEIGPSVTGQLEKWKNEISSLSTD